MVLSNLGIDLQRLAAPLPVWHAQVDRNVWSAAARAVAETGGRLISVWGVDRTASGTGMTACAAYAVFEGLVWLELRLNDAASEFPDLAGTFPCAGRMQRAMADLSGLRAEGARDERPWLDHGLWNSDSPPLQNQTRFEPARARAMPAVYAFVPVEGDGVHEIAVGPVHAGIIEPGHFRFSVVGEKVLRLEERLGYTHKGTAKLFESLSQ